MKSTKNHTHTQKSWHEFYYDVKTNFQGWLSGLKIDTYEQLKNPLITNQI